MALIVSHRQSPVLWEAPWCFFSDSNQSGSDSLDSKKFKLPPSPYTAAQWEAKDAQGSQERDQHVSG